MYEYVNRNRSIICVKAQDVSCVPFVLKPIHCFVVETFVNLQTHVYAISIVSSQLHSCCLEPLSHLKGHSYDKSENAAAVGNHVHEGTTLDMIFSATYYLELHNVISIYCIYLIVYQHMSNRLFGHYRTLTTLLGKNVHQN